MNVNNRLTTMTATVGRSKIEDAAPRDTADQADVLADGGQSAVYAAFGFNTLVVPRPSACT
jgi:hypothetical protein